MRPSALLHGQFDAGGKDLVYSVTNDGTGYGTLDAVAKPYASKLAKILVGDQERQDQEHPDIDQVVGVRIGSSTSVTHRCDG